MFLMRNKENNFPIRILIWRPDVRKNAFAYTFDLIHNLSVIKGRVFSGVELILSSD